MSVGIAFITHWDVTEEKDGKEEVRLSKTNGRSSLPPDNTYIHISNRTLIFA
jgi:hypothetical protein